MINLSNQKSRFKLPLKPVLRVKGPFRPSQIFSILIFYMKLERRQPNPVRTIKSLPCLMMRLQKWDLLRATTSPSYRNWMKLTTPTLSRKASSIYPLHTPCKAISRIFNPRFKMRCTMKSVYKSEFHPLTWYNTHQRCPHKDILRSRPPFRPRFR